jgi:hypothetical protein
MERFSRLNKSLGMASPASNEEDDNLMAQPSREELIRQYAPSFGSKTNDFSGYDESEALPTQGMQAQGLGTLLRGAISDKKAPSEFEEGGGGIRESYSPIDLITPGMVTAPAKMLGRGALSAGKAGLEMAEAGGKAFANKYPEISKRILDNSGKVSMEGSVIGKAMGLDKPLSQVYGKAIGNELPAEMSMMDRIRLAKERSGPIRQTATFEQALREQEAAKYASSKKDFFDKARQKATENDMRSYLEQLADLKKRYE